MKPRKNKFDKLAQMFTESVYYTINANGKAMLQKYLKLIKDIEANVLPVISDYVVDKTRMKQQIALQLISSINSFNMGTEEFKLMSRLDILTNSGRSPINGNSYVFSTKDPIMKYISKME